MRKLIGLIILCLNISVYGFTSNPTLKVPRWKPYDFVFKSATQPTNQFAVNFTASITGPDNIQMTLPGFYDGNNVWKIRFSPTKEGKWTITTHSDQPDLDKQQAQLICIKNSNGSIHGGLQIDRVKQTPFHL